MLEPRGEADLALEALGPQRGGELGMQHLERDRPVVLEVVRQEDGRHAAAPQLALERIQASQAVLESCTEVGHGKPRFRGVVIHIRLSL